MQPNTRFTVTSFIHQIIIPYSKEGKFDPIEIMKKLANQVHFEQRLRTPLISDNDKLVIRTASGDSPLLHVDGFSVGTLIFAIDVEIQQNAVYDVNKLATFEKLCIDWVKMCLTNTNATEWIDYIYPILIITKSDPPLTTPDIRNNMNSIATQLILSRVPNTLFFNNDAISKLISADFGYLETDLYKFSLYGCLIYDRNYSISSKQYIQDYLIPYVAKIRTVQLFLEYLNNILNEKIPISIKDKMNQNENLVFQLREISLRALATIEYPKSHTHLADVSEVLRKIFYIEKLQSEIEKKIDVLNSMLERISNVREVRHNRTMTTIGIIISIISVVVSALAIPKLTDPNFIQNVKTFFGN